VPPKKKNNRRIIGTRAGSFLA
jgi:hypothetical protein